MEARNLKHDTSFLKAVLHNRWLRPSIITKTVDELLDALGGGRVPAARIPQAGRHTHPRGIAPTYPSSTRPDLVFRTREGHLLGQALAWPVPPLRALTRANTAASLC